MASPRSNRSDRAKRKCRAVRWRWISHPINVENHIGAGLSDCNVMKTRICDGNRSFYGCDAHLGQQRQSVGVKAQAVSSVAITENERFLACARGDLRSIRSRNPGFNSEVLQLQIGWVANLQPVRSAIQQQALANLAGAESRIAGQSSVVTSGLVKTAEFTAPPTDQRGGRRCAAKSRVNSQGRAGTEIGTRDIGHQHRVTSRLAGLHVEKRQRGIGSSGEVRAIETPLKTKRWGAGSHYAEGRGLPGEEGLIRRLRLNIRGNGRETLASAPG